MQNQPGAPQEKQVKNEENKKIKEESSLFEIIYQLAKDKNEKLLAEFISKNLCVDIHQDDFTPCGQLAFENNQDAVNFLIKNFGANLNDAVRGAAFGGHLQLVEELTERGASLNYALDGAAWGGHLRFVEELIGRGAHLNYAVYGATKGGYLNFAKELIRRGADLDYAIEGAARGGHRQFVDELISRKPSLIDHAVYGASRGGHLKIVEGLIKRGASLSHAVYGAASRGDLQFVKELIGRGGSLVQALKGAARGGHLNLVQELMTHGEGGSLDNAVYGAASGGHLRLVKHWINGGASLDHAVMGAAKGGSMKLVEDLIRQGAKLEYAVEGASQGGYLQNEKIILFTISQFQDWVLRKIFLQKAKNLKYISLDVKLSLLKIKQIFEYTHKINLSFDQGFSWTFPEVRGLFSFINQTQKQKYLFNDLWFMVVNYLSPLNSSSADGLLKRDQFESKRKNVIEDAKKYYYSSGSFFFTRDAEAKKFINACSEIETEEKLSAIIDQIKPRSAGDKFFSEISKYQSKKL